MPAVSTDRMSTDRRIADDKSDSVSGRVVWAPVKSLWTGSMTMVALVAGPMASPSRVTMYIPRREEYLASVFGKLSRL